MRKYLALLLAAIMVLALFAGCSNDNANEGGDKTFKIGMVTDVGGVNDKSFNETSWKGLQDLKNADKRFEVNYLESKTDADYQGNIETFIDEGYDLIICVGYMLATATQEAALAHPDQKFAIIDDSSIDLPNVACLMFAQNQASYLVGLVAGMMTESNTVGYVQGMFSDAMNQFAVGYIAGVKAANPDAQVLQYNANSFGDAAVGKTAAVDMITKGADVIYHAAGGTGSGVIEACKENGIWAIGVDSDQSPLAPENVITSAMKRVDSAAQDISKQVADNAFKPGVHMYDLTNEGVGIAPTQTLLPENVVSAVKDAMAKVEAGEIKVPNTIDELEAVYPGAFALAE